jgi:putative transposase
VAGRALPAGWRYQAYRFELDPNNTAAGALASHAGAARFAYNTMLAYVRHCLAARDFERRVHGEVSTEVPWNAYALRKVWNNEIKSWAAPWWAQNSKEAYASGIAALALALDNFSKSRRGVRRGRSVGFPRHKRKTSRRSFTVSTGCFGVADARHVRLPIIGVVRTKEPTVKLAALLDAGRARVLAATVSETAGRWFVSLRVEMAAPARQHRPDPATVAGVDLGVKTLATVVTVTGPADGPATETVEVVPNPKPLNRWQRKLARQARQMSRRQPGSRRRARTAASLARTHHKVANARRDGLHKLTSRLAATAGTVVVEDLNVAGMVRNRRLARAVSDAASPSSAASSPTRPPGPAGPWWPPTGTTRHRNCAQPAGQ